MLMMVSELECPGWIPFKNQEVDWDNDSRLNSSVTVLKIY